MMDMLSRGLFRPVMPCSPVPNPAHTAMLTLSRMAMKASVANKRTLCTSPETNVTRCCSVSQFQAF